MKSIAIFQNEATDLCVLQTVHSLGSIKMKQDLLNVCASRSLLSIWDYAATVKINACSSGRGNKILNKFAVKATMNAFTAWTQDNSSH